MMETTDAEGLGRGLQCGEAVIMHNASMHTQWFAWDKYVHELGISYVIVGKAFLHASALSFGPIPREIF
jgi:hypothetical protein